MTSQTGNGTPSAGSDAVFVTGGGGFIGRAVIDRLLAEGQDVVVLDLVAPQQRDVEFRKTDICDLDQCLENLKGARRVIHLAGLVAGPANKDPRAAVAVNVLGATNIFEACAQLEVEVLVWASTFFVYEDCGLEHVDEQTNLDIRTMGPFARSKYICEQIARDYEKKRNLHHVGLRFGSVYGPGNGSNVIRAFAEQAVKGEEIVVWGEGKRDRQFIYVDDIADAVVEALSHRDSGVFNVAGRERTTTRQVLEHIQKLVPDVKVSYDLSKPEKVQPYTICLKQVETGLGWLPATEIDQGIARTVQWVRQQQAAPAST